MVEMRVLDGEKFAHGKLLDVAASCVHAIHKAPQVSGRVKVRTLILTGKVLEYMFEAQGILGRVAVFNILSGASWQRTYYADEPPVLLLIGAENLSRSELNWDCGACGFKTCAEMNRYHAQRKDKGNAVARMMMQGPVCMWKLFDFGVVCDWACAACWQMNVTNRIEAASGMCARAIGFLEDCDVVYGLPIGPMQDLYWYSRDFIGEMDHELWLEHAQVNYPTHWSVFPGHGRPTIKYGQKWWESQRERQLKPFDHEGHLQIAEECLQEVAALRERTRKFLDENGIRLDSPEASSK
ncbi:MAG: DUF2148 domain-containing protein [bacterium]